MKFAVNDILVAGVPKRFRRETFALMLSVDIQPASDAPGISALIFMESGTNSSTRKRAVPKMSWGLFLVLTEYRRTLYSPTGAAADMSYLMSNIPSAFSEKVRSIKSRPRESVISILTGTPAKDLNDLFFTMPPITMFSPGR